MALWVLYSLLTRQWGFIPGALIYAGVYWHCYRHWGRLDAKDHA